MAVVIRLARQGNKGRPAYRIVAAAKHRPRDGKFIEILGAYNPRQNPPYLMLKEERVKHWIGVGALASATVEKLIEKQLPGLITSRRDHQRKKIQAARKARKTRLSAKKKK